MKKKVQFDLCSAIYYVIQSNEPMQNCAKKLNGILKETGLSEEEVFSCIAQSQTIGNAKYRILGLMDKKKIDSSHII